MLGFFTKLHNPHQGYSHSITSTRMSQTESSTHPGAHLSAQSDRRFVVVGLTYPFRGGISHYSTLLVRTLRRRYQVEFLTLKRQYPGLLFPGQSQYDYSATTLDEPNQPILDSLNPLTWIRAARRINQLAPALTVIQWWHPFFAPPFGVMAHLLNNLQQRRLCFLCHNVMPHESNPLQSALTRFAFRKAPFFVVHSEQDRAQLLALKPSARVRRGSHPTYDEFATEEVPSKGEARAMVGVENKPTLLFFGLVRAYKGLRFLIEALPIIREQIDCQLVVAGEFYDDPQPYLDLIAKLGVTGHVRVVNEYIPNESVANYFHAADVAVLPYVSATQSGIVQIAFGVHRPVITTNVGGLPEAVEHGVTGLVVPPEDRSAIASAVIDYYQRDLEEQFQRNIQSQKDRFDWDQEVEFLESFASAVEDED